MSDRPAPRSSSEIFSDLRNIAQCDGALHHISAIIYRDWIVTYDTVEDRVVDSADHRWSTAKLNQNELMLIMGLMVQSQSDRTFTICAEDESFAPRVDQLLREFHDRVLDDRALSVDTATGEFKAHPESIGLVAKEAIYYSASSIYLHQFKKFGRYRYRDDATWLLQNAGLSIRPMIDIATFITNRINSQILTVGHAQAKGQEFTNPELSDSLLISKEDRGGSGKLNSWDRWIFRATAA